MLGVTFGVYPTPAHAVGTGSWLSVARSSLHIIHHNICVIARRQSKQLMGIYLYPEMHDCMTVQWT